jgi:hypothetical protein
MILYESPCIQGYSRETADENFVICNPKYKKPPELDILFAIQVAWQIILIMTLSPK